MSRSRVSLFAVAIVGAAGVLGARQEPQFRTAIDTVPIYATVVDRDSRLVTDLTRDDFEVYDNGRRQTLTTFANDIQPITVVMMLDRSGSVEEQFKLIEDAAAEFINNLTPADKARLGSFSLEVQIDPEEFTSNKSELLGILRERMQPIGPTPLWTAASKAMTALADQSGRRVVLIFTDGHDAPLSDQPKVSFDEVRRRAEVEEVMVYGVGLVAECDTAGGRAPSLTSAILAQRGGRGGQGSGQGRGGPGRGVPGRVRLPPVPLPLPLPPRGGYPKPPSIPDTPRIAPDYGCKAEGPDPNLRALAEVGGGGFFELRRAADLKTTFSRVANELHHQYLLAFVAPAKDGTLHHLDVRVRQAGLVVRARRAYIAPK